MNVKIPPVYQDRRIIMRISTILSIGLVLVFLSIACSNTQAADLTLNNTPTQIYFSPNGGCTEAIVKEIGKAKQEILVQAYSFTSKDIAKALVDAHKRGVKTEIILDKSNRSKNILLETSRLIWGLRPILTLLTQLPTTR